MSASPRFSSCSETCWSESSALHIVENFLVMRSLWIYPCPYVMFRETLLISSPTYTINPNVILHKCIHPVSDLYIKKHNDFNPAIISHMIQKGSQPKPTILLLLPWFFPFLLKGQPRTEAWFKCLFCHQLLSYFEGGFFWLHCSSMPFSRDITPSLLICDDVDMWDVKPSYYIEKKRMTRLMLHCWSCTAIWYR